MNPIHYMKPPRRKTENAETPEGQKDTGFPENLQYGFFFSGGGGGGVGCLTMMMAPSGRTGMRPMGRRGQLPRRFWRILMMLQRTMTTRRVAWVVLEEGGSPSMPRLEHPLWPPLASCYDLWLLPHYLKRGDMIGHARLVDARSEGGTDEGSQPSQGEHRPLVSLVQSHHMIHGGVAGQGCSYPFWDFVKLVEICSS